MYVCLSQIEDRQYTHICSRFFIFNERVHLSLCPTTQDSI